MRDIRARIAQRHGIELSTQQIQELAARRLEAILDPRHVKPHCSNSSARRRPPTDAPARPVETYEVRGSHAFRNPPGLLRFFRRLLNPILKLFFNPTPLSPALNPQAASTRTRRRASSKREHRQTEWNALQFELVQRMVLETVARQHRDAEPRRPSRIAQRQVDFNERRVRGLETVPAATSPRPRHVSREEPSPLQRRDQRTEGGVSRSAHVAATSPRDGQERRRLSSRPQDDVGGAAVAAAAARHRCYAPAATGPSQQRPKTTSRRAMATESKTMRRPQSLPLWRIHPVAEVIERTGQRVRKNRQRVPEEGSRADRSRIS